MSMKRCSTTRDCGRAEHAVGEEESVEEDLVFAKLPLLLPPPLLVMCGMKAEDVVRTAAKEFDRRVMIGSSGCVATSCLCSVCVMPPPEREGGREEGGECVCACVCVRE